MVSITDSSRRIARDAGLLLLCSMALSSPAIAQEIEASESAAQPAGEVPTPPADVELPEVDAIITEEEFELAVPGLDLEDDPELHRPLELIEEFDRRLAEEQADAELTKPLPRIEEFEVSAVEFAEAVSGPQPVEIAYATKLNGLDSADAESRAGLRNMFRRLSALREGDGKAANIAMVSARLEDDVQLVKTILASEGWFDPHITSRIVQPSDADGQTYTAVIDVEPGLRFQLSEIILDAEPTIPSDLISSNLALRIGEPVIAERIQGAEAQVAVALPQEGYPFAQIGDRDILLDRQTGDGIYTLHVETGPRSLFGEFETAGHLAFNADHIEVLARFEKGELYDSRKIDDLRKALVATGLFSAVSVEPKRTGHEVGDDQQFASIFVQQDAGPPRTIAGSAGYGTGEGLRLEAIWTHRNMFPPEGALIAHGIAGTKEQGGGVTFRRSNAGRRDRAFELTAEALHSEFDAYSAYTGRLAGQMRYSSTPIWQKKFAYSYGVELLATAEKDYNFDLSRRDRRTYYIAGVNGQAQLDLTDDLLDPTEGARVTVFVRPEGSIDEGFYFYVKSQFDASAYYSPSRGLVLAGRVRLGSIQGADRADIAPSRRFYAGGGGSVRGYGYQQLGPLDPNGDPIGGRSLNEASGEVRYRSGNYGAVAFVDVGQSYVETLPRFSNLRVGAGIGGRFYTNFGPIRLDVATPINRRPGESRFNIYVSIGQAF